MAGLKRAKENGRIGGRKMGLSDDAKKKAYAAFHLTEENKKRPNEQKLSNDDIVKVLSISRATYYRYFDFAKTSVVEKSAKKIWKKKGRTD